MNIKYKIKGLTLNAMEMADIKNEYELLCTAEYIQDNYNFNENDAIEKAKKVRNLIDKYEYTEAEAIAKII